MNQAYCYWMWKNNQIHSKMSTLLRKFLYKPFLTENERENFHFSDIKFCQPLGADGFGTVYVRSTVGQKYAVKHLHNTAHFDSFQSEEIAWNAKTLQSVLNNENKVQNKKSFCASKSA